MIINLSLKTLAIFKVIWQVIKSEIIESDYYYTAKLTLDPNIACKYTQLEVMFNAGAKKLPKYEETVITISMNENWQVQQIIMHDVYEIKVKLGVAINAPVDATIVGIVDKNQ